MKTVIFSGTKEQCELFVVLNRDKPQYREMTAASEGSGYVVTAYRIVLIGKCCPK